MILPRTSNTGLTEEQAKVILATEGLNETKTDQFSWFKCLISQFKSPITYLLIFSAVISSFTGELVDSLVIFLIVIINVLIGFHQEYKASNLAEKLKSFITKQTLVIRGGKEYYIESQFLVKGDLIRLKLGDIIPADCIITESNNLTANESAITGESIPIEKKLNDTLFSGSSIQAGTTTAVIRATGPRSQFGEVANLALNTVKKSEFSKSMNKLSIGFLIVGVVYFILIFSLQIILSKQESISASLLFILALTISIVPEALPVVTSLALASKSLKLAKKGLIVKHQTTLEDLGNIDILCSDKTGTLTDNKLTIQEFYPANQSFINDVIALTIGGNDILDLAGQAYQNKNISEFKDYGDYKLLPFDPNTKTSGKEYKDYSIIRGAPEQILNMCEILENELDNTKNKILSDIKVKEILGLKSICYAKKLNNDSINAGYIYHGVVYYADEIKENTDELIQQCRKLDLKIKIITGDSLEVSQYIATKAGLIRSDKESILSSELDFENIDIFRIQLDSHSVFARCNPLQKFKIIEGLQTKYVVGYLGDGINDAPSLKLAQVGIVVDTASDIAKSTADIIMTKGDLNAIIDGVIEGRKVYENINKYIKQSLSGNFGNFFTLGLFSLILNFPPILAIQVLIVNLITDLPLVSVAVDNVKRNEVRKPKHQIITRLLLVTFVLGIISSIFDFIFYSFNKHLPPGQIQTSWFTFSILTELVLLFSIRTKNPFWKAASIKPNMIITTIIALIITYLLSTLGFKYMNISTIDQSQFIRIACIVFVYIITSEIVKVIYYKVYTTESD